jgi:pullulanase
VKTATFSSSTVDGSFTVPAMTTAVFLKPQGEAQGTGLAASPNEVPVPFGDTEIFLRGINTWDAVNLMRYQGAGVYSFTTSLAPGDYQFKIADADWGAVNLGFDQVSFAADSIAATNADGNIAVTLNSFATYTFSINATGETPVITIALTHQIIACDALANVPGEYPLTVAGTRFPRYLLTIAKDLTIDL